MIEMLSILKNIGLVVLILNVIACAGSKDKKDGSYEHDLSMCEEPRPQICTREYNPVCATMKNGTKKTGSTGCTSCTNPEVVGYTPGVC